MPNATSASQGVTFAVDQVTPATAPLPECKMFEAASRTLGDDFESCCDYHSSVVKGVDYQPLLAAVYLAFSQHRPLVLTPDSVWITIAQGVAHHMALHGEALRSRFVAHHGKLDLVFTCRDWVERSPENPWPQAFASWTSQIRDHIGPNLHDLLLCDFSTTGPIERSVSQIVMMDIFERYFHYVAVCICGIPTVTLEGTPADWERLAQKVRGLRIFDMDWWLDHLIPICDQFVRASRGEVDVSHWQEICKKQSDYGGDIINGWIAKLFPYIRAYWNGPCTQRNPIFETGEGFQTSSAPSGLSQVPFTWINLARVSQRRMEAIGGLMGVTQDPQTLSLRPKVGWAVHPAKGLSVLLDRLAAEHVTHPGRSMVPKAIEDFRTMEFIKPDLAEFYPRTNGATLGRGGSTTGITFVPFEGMKGLDSGEAIGTIIMGGPGGRVWHRIAWLPDGTWLAINLDWNTRSRLDQHPELRAKIAEREDCFAPICHGSGKDPTHGVLHQRPWMPFKTKYPVVALTFTELLKRLLNNGGQPYWLDGSFAGYGDANQFTQRG